LSQEKDELTKQKIIAASNHKEKYAQFFKKLKLREDWKTKHNFNIIHKEGMGDWRTAFKFIISSKSSQEPQKKQIQE